MACARVKVGFAQPTSNHFRETHQRGFQLRLVSSVFVVGVFVADRLGVMLSSNFAVEPSACVFTAGFARKCKAPFPEALFQFAFFQFGEVADLLNAERVKMALHHFAHAGNFPDVERREKLRLFARQDPENAVGFGLS